MPFRKFLSSLSSGSKSSPPSSTCPEKGNGNGNDESGIRTTDSNKSSAALLHPETTTKHISFVSPPDEEMADKAPVPITLRARKGSSRPSLWVLEKSHLLYCLDRKLDQPDMLVNSAASGTHYRDFMHYKSPPHSGDFGLKYTLDEAIRMDVRSLKEGYYFVDGVYDELPVRSVKGQIDNFTDELDRRLNDFSFSRHFEDEDRKNVDELRRLLEGYVQSAPRSGWGFMN